MVEVSGSRLSKAKYPIGRGVQTRDQDPQQKECHYVNDRAVVDGSEDQDKNWRHRELLKYVKIGQRKRSSVTER